MTMIKPEKAMYQRLIRRLGGAEEIAGTVDGVRITLAREMSETRNEILYIEGLEMIDGKATAGLLAILDPGLNIQNVTVHETDPVQRKLMVRSEALWNDMNGTLTEKYTIHCRAMIKAFLDRMEAN